MYIFPTDIVKPGEKILIYGAGRVGKEWAQWVEKSGYCSVLAFLDLNADSISVCCGRSVLHPKRVGDFFKERILLAVKDNKMRESMARVLFELGVEEDRIIRSPVNNLQIDGAKETFGVEDEILHVAFLNMGGLGDGLLTLPLAGRVKSLYGSRVLLTFIGRYGVMYENGATVFDNFLDADVSTTGINLFMEKFDIIVYSQHVSSIVCWAPEKVRRLAPELNVFCLKCIEYARSKPSLLQIYLMARLLGKNRIGVSDLFGTLGELERNVFFRWESDSFNTLKKFALYGKRYVVLNRDVDIRHSSSHPKLWPSKSYAELVKLLKARFPKLSLVLVGTRVIEGDVWDGIDFDLRGQTSLDETKVVLKYSDTLITSEGGLAHLNHLLYNRSTVIFGPTDECYFGYSEDVHCVSRNCGMPCNYIIGDWSSACARGLPSADCMASVTANMVLEKASTIIESHNYRYEVCGIERDKAKRVFAVCKNDGGSILTVGGQSLERVAELNYSNYPSYESCFDMVFVETDSFSDPYAVVNELLRLLLVSGELFLPRNLLHKFSELLHVPYGQEEYVCIKKYRRK